MKAQEKFVRVEGLLTHYFQAGTKGIPLILLHGTSESAVDWSWTLPLLALNYQVYAPDFPGHGRSDKPIRDYSLSFLTEFVMGFLDALNLSSVVLVGNSLGGLIALRVALSAQERIKSLVLVDSTGLGETANLILCALTLPFYGEAGLIGCQTPIGAILRARVRSVLFFAHPENVPHQWFLDQERMTQIPQSMNAALSALRAQLNPFGQRVLMLDALRTLEIPTLIVWGNDDQILPKTQAETAVKYLQQGELVLIPSCGHIPPVEQPERFVAALNQFLTRTENNLRQQPESEVFPSKVTSVPTQELLIKVDGYLSPVLPSNNLSPTIEIELLSDGKN